MIVVNTSVRAEALDRRLSLCLVSWPLEALSCAPRALQRNFPAREDLLDALVDPHDRVVRQVTDGFPRSNELHAVQERVVRRSTALNPLGEAVAARAPVVGR